MNKHEHKWVPLGRTEVHSGLGDRPLYWCRDCGAIMEKLDLQIAIIIPEWSKARLENGKEHHSFVHQQIKQLRPTKGRLGKGLVELMAGNKGMRCLPGMKGKGDD